MADLLKYIMRLIIETIFCGSVWNLWSKTIINPESSLYYKTIFYKLKNHYYSLQVLIALAYAKILKNLHGIKYSKKDETNTIIGITLIISIIIIYKFAKKYPAKKREVLVAE